MIDSMASLHGEEPGERPRRRETNEKTPHSLSLRT